MLRNYRLVGFDFNGLLGVRHFSVWRNRRGVVELMEGVALLLLLLMLLLLLLQLMLLLLLLYGVLRLSIDKPWHTESLEPHTTVQSISIHNST